MSFNVVAVDVIRKEQRASEAPTIALPGNREYRVLHRHLDLIGLVTGDRNFDGVPRLVARDIDTA